MTNSFASTFKDIATARDVIYATLDKYLPEIEVWANKAQLKGEELMGFKQTSEAQGLSQLAYQQQLVAAGFVRSGDGTWMAASDPRLKTVQYYVDAEGRLTVLRQGQTVSGTQVASANMTTDVTAQGVTEQLHGAASYTNLGIVGSLDIKTLTNWQISQYMHQNHAALKNHLALMMNSPREAEATLAWLESNPSLLAGDYASRWANSSYDAYFTKLFTDIGAGLVSVLQDDRVASGPGTTLLDPRQRGTLTLLHRDPNAEVTNNAIKDFMSLTPLDAPQRLQNVIGDFKHWDWTLVHGAKTLLDVAATAGDVLVVGKAFSVNLQGIVKGAEAFTVNEAGEVFINVTNSNGESAIIHGVNRAVQRKAWDTFMLEQGLVQHVEEGILITRKNGIVVGEGMHLELSANPETTRFTHMSAPDKNGVYDGYVSFLDTSTGIWTEPKYSTFFPKDWGPERLSAERDAAFMSAVRFSRNDNGIIDSWRGTSPTSSIKFQGGLSPSGALSKSYYPILTK